MSERRPDIALLLVAAAGGGAERAMIGVASRLVHQGYTVDIVLLRKTGPFLEEIDPAIRVVDLDTRKLRNTLLSLNRYMKMTRPKLLISALCQGDPLSLFGKALFGWKGSNIHVSVQNSPETGARASKDPVTRAWPHAIRWLYRFATSINAISHGVAGEVERLMGKPAGALPVIHNPVDIVRITAMAAETPEHDWLRDKNIPVLLAVGRLTLQKDFATLLRAHAKLRAERPVRLLILGEGQDRAMLQTLVVELGTAHDVLMPGFATNPFAAMAAADVFVLSSRWEGFANVVAEALACGAKIVSTDCPSGPAEILEGGRYGTLVPMQDVDALAKAMGEAIDAEVDRDVLRARAGDFAIDGIVRQYRELFESKNLIA